MEAEIIEELLRVAILLGENQVELDRLDPEAKAVLYANLWDLYA